MARNYKIKKNLDEKNFENKKLSWYYFIPFLLLISFVPLIVYGKYLELKGLQLIFWNGADKIMDYFSYWKSRWIVFLTFTALTSYLIAFFDKKVTFKKNFKYYIPLLIYFIFVIISTTMSFSKEISTTGFTGMYQNIWVLVSYGLLTLLTFNMINKYKDITIIVQAFVFLAIVEGIIGVTQYFGLDIFKSTIFQRLIVPMWMEVPTFNFNFGKYTIFGTMYNSNFIGSFATIIIPICTAILVISTKKKEKIIYGVALFLSACLWIGCNSRAGYIGVVSVAITTVALLKNQIIKNYKFVITLLAGLLLIVITFNTISNGKTLNQFSRLRITKEVDKIEKLNDDDNIKFKDIELDKREFSILTNKNTLTVKLNNDKLLLFNDKLNKLNTTKDEEGYFIIEDERYIEYKILIFSESSSIDVIAYNRVISFCFTQEGVKIIGCGGRLVEPIVAPTFKLLDGYDRFATNRGYIWSRTIAMLPNVIFRGYGPDTFPVVFPQDDFIAKLNAGMDASTIVDKPHNMYLQIAINTGIISLLALLALWGIYLISSLKLYKGMTYDSSEKCIGYACFMAVIGYLVAGIFNDQIVSVAPLFWITLGLGISINERLKYKNKA